MLVGHLVAGVLAQPLAPLDVGVDRAALDRPGPHAAPPGRSGRPRFSGRVRCSICICARLSIWKTPVVSAAWIARRHLVVVERDPREIDRARRARARSHPRTARPPRASRARAGRSSGSRRPRRSPCPTARSAGPPSRPAAPGTRSISGVVEDDHPARVLRDVARQPAISGSSSASARQRGERARGLPSVSAIRRHDRGSPRRRRRRARAARSRRAAGRSALPRSRIGTARPVGGEGRDQRRALRARSARAPAGSASRGCRAGSRGRCPAPSVSSSFRKRPRKSSFFDRVDVREAGQVADERADTSSSRGRGPAAAASRPSPARAPRRRPRAPARACPGGAGRSRRAAARLISASSSSSRRSASARCGVPS